MQGFRSVRMDCVGCVLPSCGICVDDADVCERWLCVVLCGGDYCGVVCGLASLVVQVVVMVLLVTVFVVVVVVMMGWWC